MGIIEKQSVQDIANAIRNRNGLTTLYKPREMDEAILNLYSTTKVNSMLDYILPCYEKEATSYTIQYADADRPGSITKLEGNTTQNGTPTPTNPIPIYTVSGDNEVVVSNEQHVTGNSYRVDFGDIELCKIGNYVDKLKRAEGKQLFNKDTVEQGYINADGTLASSDTNYRTSDFIPVSPNTAYYKTYTASPRTKFFDANKQPLNTSTYQDLSIGGNAGSFTTPANAVYFRFSYPINNTSVVNIMLNEGSTALPYEPYGNNWYIEKNIGKVELNGSETWYPIKMTNVYGYYTVINAKPNINNASITGSYCNYFTEVTPNDNWASSTTARNFAILNTTGYIRFANGDSISGESQMATFKTWLGTNNVTVYFILATPTYEIITNENLIQQLNAIQNIELIENLCYVDWVGTEKPKMKLFCYLDKDKIIEEITG